MSLTFLISYSSLLHTIYAPTGQGPRAATSRYPCEASRPLPTHGNNHGSCDSKRATPTSTDYGVDWSVTTLIRKPYSVNFVVCFFRFTLRRIVSSLYLNATWIIIKRPPAIFLLKRGLRSGPLFICHLFNLHAFVGSSERSPLGTKCVSSVALCTLT